MTILNQPRGLIATLESFLMDSFTVIADGKETYLDRVTIGGAGTYIGARIFLPASRLTMIVDYTPETLPKAMEDQLLSFGDMWRFRQRTDGHGTTRSINRWDGVKIDFDYLTTPIHIMYNDLDATPAWTHLCSNPTRTKLCLDQQESGVRLVWEPDPSSCVPENMGAIGKLIRRVDIISPNHIEAMSMFGEASGNKETLEWIVRRLVAFNPKIAAVIRAGARGCVYALPGDDKVYWCPAYWTDQKQVVDVTGAGNSFLGGLTAALDEGNDMHEGGFSQSKLTPAVIWATVAASFIVQQDGLPTMTTVHGREFWNGEFAWTRVEKLKKRIGKQL